MKTKTFLTLNTIALLLTATLASADSTMPPRKVVFKNQEIEIYIESAVDAEPNVIASCYVGNVGSEEYYFGGRIALKTTTVLEQGRVKGAEIVSDNPDNAHVTFCVKRGLDIAAVNRPNFEHEWNKYVKTGKWSIFSAGLCDRRFF